MRSKLGAATLLLLLCQLAGVYGSASPVPGTAIFARQNPNCIVCEQADCTKCPADAPRCKMTAQTCDTCPKIECFPNKPTRSAKASTGAIVGASIGGFASAAMLIYIAWRMWGNKRANRTSLVASAAEKETDFGMLRSARASTHTVASIASTVRTRASNVIQIAYIPGVTNRSSPSTPALLVPPVPPLPFADSPVGSQFPRSPTGDIQFAADDLLRGSVCTMGTVPDNRSSIATTIYGGNAVVASPNFIRAGKAAVVQVKSGSSAGNSNDNSPADSVPAIPPLFTTGAGATRQNTQLETIPPSPAFSVGSTFFNRMNSTNGSHNGKAEWEQSPDQPQKRLVPGRSHIPENHCTSSLNYDSDDTEHDLAPGHRGGKLESMCSSVVTDMEAGSPFSDENSILDTLPLPPGAGLPPPGNGSRVSMNLSAGGQRTPSTLTPRSSERTISPFGDENAADKTPRLS